MNDNFSTMRILLAAFILLSPLHVVMADFHHHDDDGEKHDHVEARHLLESGEILPLEDILKNVRYKFPGKIIEVELEKINQRIVYEIEILSDYGVITELYINPKTGEVLYINEGN